MSIERLEMDLGADTTGEVVGGAMDPTRSGEAAGMTPGGQTTSGMADPTTDELPSSSNQSNHIRRILLENTSSPKRQKNISTEKHIYVFL